jgi:hypothetical protein
MFKNTKVGWYIGNELMGVNTIKRHKRWDERRKAYLKIRQENDMMIRVYGKLRFYLSLWFGQWVLFAWNHREYKGE